MGLLLPTRGRETTSSSSGSIFSHCRQRTAAARAPPLVEFSSNTRADELCAPAAHTHTTAERDKSYPPVMRGMFVGGRCGSCFGGLSRRPPFRQIKDKLLRLLRRRLPSLLLPSIPSLARLRSAWLVQAAKGRGGSAAFQIFAASRGLQKYLQLAARYQRSAFSPPRFAASCV